MLASSSLAAKGFSSATCSMYLIIGLGARAKTDPSSSSDAESSLFKGAPEKSFDGDAAGELSLSVLIVLLTRSWASSSSVDSSPFFATTEFVFPSFSVKPKASSSALATIALALLLCRGLRRPRMMRKAEMAIRASPPTIEEDKMMMVFEFIESEELPTASPLLLLMIPELPGSVGDAILYSLAGTSELAKTVATRASGRLLLMS
mmetsp:Transcript_30423/g.88963  ORF Transcript_30423/g.88963 Transcript_30423/m.88963 type:complete len:205 (-) Transcript_30423:2560-3174(-)